MGEYYLDSVVADEAGSPASCAGCSELGCPGRGYGCENDERYDELEVAA